MLNRFVCCIFTETFLTGAVPAARSTSRRRRRPTQQPYGITDPMQTHSSEENISSENDSNFSEDSLMCADENVPTLDMMPPTVDEIRNVTHFLEGMTSALMLGDTDQSLVLPPQGHGLKTGQEFTMLRRIDQEVQDEVKTGQCDDIVPSVSIRRSSTGNTEIAAGQVNYTDTQGHTQDSMDLGKGTSELGAGQVGSVPGVTNRKRQQLVMAQVDVWHTPTETCPASPDQMDQSITGPSERADNGSQVTAGEQPIHPPASKRELVEASRRSEEDVSSTVESNGEEVGDDELLGTPGQIERGRESFEVVSPGGAEVVLCIGDEPSANVALMEYEDPVSLPLASLEDQGISCLQNLQLGLRGQKHSGNSSLPHHSVESGNYNNRMTPHAAVSGLSVDNTTAHTVTELSTEHTTPHAVTETSVDHATPHAVTETSMDHATPHAVTETSVDHATPHAVTETSMDHATPHAVTETSVDHATPHAVTETSVDHATPHAVTETSVDHTTPHAVTETSVDHTTPHAVTETSIDHTTPHAVTETSVDHATPHAVTETSMDHATPHAITETSVDHTTPHAVTETSVDHATPHAVTETSVDHTTPHAVTETSIDHTTPHAVTETSVNHATPHAVTETSMDHATPHAVTETSMDHATPHAVTETYVDHTTPHAVTETSVDHATPHAVTETSVDHATPHAVTETSVDHATPHAVTETSIDHTTPHAVTETSVDHTTPNALTETSVDHTTPHAITETSVDHATPHAVTETSMDHATPHAVTETSVDHATPHAVTETSVDHTTPHAVTETSVDHATPHAVTETSMDHATPHAVTETSMDHATPHAVTETSVDHTTPHAVTETSVDHATPHAVTETSVDHTTPHAVTETSVDHATPHAVTETSVDHATPHAVTETSVDHATPQAVTETSVDYTTPHAVTETSIDHATPHAVTETSVDHATPQAVTETSVDYTTPHAVTETSVDYTTPHAVTETSIDHATPHAVTETSVDHATPQAVTETSVDHTTPHAVTETSIDHATPHAVTETSMDHATPHAVTETSVDHATPHAVTETSVDHATPHAVTETSVDHATPHAVTETSVDHATPHAVTETSMDHATPHAVTETSVDHATPHAVTETSMDHTTPHAVTETSMDHATPHAITETSMDHATPHAVTETSVDHATPHAVTETSMDHATPHAVTETSMDHATPHAVTETSMDHTTPHAVTETSVDQATPHAVTETSVDHATPHAVTELSMDHVTPHAVTETSVDHATPHAVTETSMDHATPHAVTETSVDHTTPHALTETYVDHTTPHTLTETSVDHATPHAVTETSMDHATPHAVTETSVDHATPHAVTELSMDHVTPHAVTETSVDHEAPHAVTETSMDHATPHAVTETSVDHTTPHALTETSVDHTTPHALTETSVDHATPHAVTETSVDHATPHAVTELSMDHATPHVVTETSVDHATPHDVTETSVDHATPQAVTETSVDHATPHAVTETSVDHATPHAVTETYVDHATPPAVTETSVDHATPPAVTETSVDHVTPHAVTETSVDHATPPAVTETSVDHATPHAVTETSVDHATPPAVTETSVDHATPHAVTETYVDHATPQAVTETSVDHATPPAVTETSMDHATPHAVTETSVDHATPHAVTETSVDHATTHAVTETSVDHATPHAVTETYVDHAIPHAVTETYVDHATPHAIIETSVDHETPHAVTETSVDHATPHAITETSVDHATPHAVTETSVDHATPHAIIETSVDHTTPHAVTETSVNHETPHAVTETSVDHATPHAVTETSVDHATPHAVTETSVDHETPHAVTETSVDHATPHAVTETSVNHATPHAVTETCVDHVTPHAVTETSLDHTTYDAQQRQTDVIRKDKTAGYITETPKERKSDVTMAHQLLAVNELSSPPRQTLESSGRDTEPTEVCQPTDIVKSSGDDVSKSTTSGNIESAIALSDADVIAISAQADTVEGSDIAKMGQAHVMIDTALSTGIISGQNPRSIHVSEDSCLPSGGDVRLQKQDSSMIASADHEDINVGSRMSTDSSQATAVSVSDVRNTRPCLDKPETILTIAEDISCSGNQQEDLSDHISAEPQPSHSVETITADPAPATSAIHQDMTIHEPTGDQASNHNFTTKHSDPGLAGGLSPGNEGRSSVTGVLGDNIKAGLCMPWQPVTGGSCISELTTASPNVSGISEQSSVPLTRERSVCGTEPVVDTAEPSHTETTGTPLQVIHGDSKFAGKLLPDYSARKQPSCAQLQEDPCGSRLDYSTEEREVVVPTASQQHDTSAGRLGGHEESVVACSLHDVPIASDFSAVGGPVVFAETPCVSGVPVRQHPGHLQTTDTSDVCVDVGDTQGHQSETVLELAADVRQVNAATDNKQPTSDRETDRIPTSHQNIIELVASVPQLSQETAVGQTHTALQGNRSEGIVGRVANEGSHLDDICSELYSIHSDGNDTANDTAVTTRNVSVSLDNDEAPGPMADPPVAAGDRALTDDGDTGPRVRTTDRTHADDKGASRNTQSEVAPSAVNRRTGSIQRCDVSLLPTTLETSSDQSVNNLVKSKLYLRSAHDDEESIFDGSLGDTCLPSSDTDAGSFELVHFKAPELRRRMRRRNEENDTRKMESLEKSAVVFLMDAAFEELIENVVREGWEYATVADTDGMSHDGYATSDVMDSDGPDRRSNDAEISQDTAGDAIMQDTEESGENAGRKPESNSAPLLRNSATLLRNESNLSMFVNIDEDQVMSDDEFDDDNRGSTTFADTIGPSLVDDVVLTQIPERGTDSANPSLVPNIDEEPEEIVEEDIELMHWISGEDSRDEVAEDGSSDEAGASQEPVSTRDTRGASSGHPRGAFDRHQDGRPSASSGDQASGGKNIDSEETAAVSVSFDDGYCTLLMPSDASLNDSGNVTHVTVQDISTEDTEHDVSFSTLGEVEECAGERTNIPPSVNSGLGPGEDSFDDVPAHSSPVRHVQNPHVSRDAPWPVTTSTCNEEVGPPLDHGSYRLTQCKQPEEGVRGQTEDAVHPLELSQILQMINSEFDELANLVAHEGWEYATVTTRGRTNGEESGTEATEGVTNGLSRRLSLFVNTGDADDQQISDDEVDERTDNVLDRFRLMLEGGNQSKSTSLMTTIGDEPEDIEDEEIEFMQLSDRGIDGESEPCGDTPVDGLQTTDTGDATAITASGQSQQQPDRRSHLKAQPSDATTDINNPDVKHGANAPTEPTAKKMVVLVDTKVIGFDIQPDHPYSTSHAPDLQHSILFETQSRYNYFRDDGAPLLMADVQILGVQPPLATPRPRRTRTAPPGDVVRDRPIASCLQHLRYSALDIEIKPLGGERQGGVVVVDGEGVDIDEQDLSGSYHSDTVNRSRPPRSQSLTLIPRRGCVIAGAPVSGGAYIDTAGTSLLDTDDMVVVRPPEGSPDGDQNPDVSADSTESVETVIAVTTEDNETDNRAAAIVPLTPAQLAESARLRLAWMHLFGMPTDDLRLFPRRYNSVETQTSFNSSRSSSSSSPSLDINSGNSEMIEDFQARLLISQFIEEAAEIVPPSDDEYTSSDGSQHSLSPGEVDMYSSDTFLSSSSLESIPEALDLEDEPDEQEAMEEPWPLTSTLLQSDDENMADTEDNVDQDASNDSITYVFLSHSRSLHEMGLWDDGATPLHRPTSEPTCADDTPRSYAYNHLGLPLKERSVSLNEIQYLLPETLSSGHRSVSLDLSKQMLTEDIAPEDIFGGHFEDAELELSDEPSGTRRRHHKVATASTSCQVDTCTLGTGSSSELWNADSESQPRVVEISSPPNQRSHDSPLGLTETCETTLERPGEIAIRLEVRPGGLQVSHMHITDLVPASLHVETRRPGSYYVSVRGRHRTIETQTYPELRVIETQTSDGENNMMKAERETSPDDLEVGSPVEKQTIDAELSVITVDTGVSASPPGGQSPVLFSRYIKPDTDDHLAGVDVCVSPRLQEVTSNDSTGSLNEELSISISDQTQTSATGDQQFGGLTADVPSTASVQTQSETCDDNVAKSRWDPDVSTPSLTGSTEEVDTSVTADQVSGSDISDLTDTTPSPVLVTFDVPAAEEHIHNQRGTSSDSTQQREDTAETSSPKSPTPQTVFGIDRTDMGTSKAEHRKVDLQPCTVETVRSEHVNRTVDADRQISGEPVCSSAPRSRLLDAAVVTNCLFSVDRTVQVDGDSSNVACKQVQSSGIQCVETEALADMSPRKLQGDSPHRTAESQIAGTSKTHSGIVSIDGQPSAQENQCHTVTDANETTTTETHAKDHTGKSTSATATTQSVRARPSKSGPAKKARNVKGKQSRKLRNSLDSIPAAQRMAKSKRSPSESLAQSAQNLSVVSAETSKGTVSDMSKVTTPDTTSDIPASRTVVTAQGRTASQKSKHSTELKTSVSPSAVKPDNEIATTKEASTKTAASGGGDSDIQQMVTKYQAIKHLIENGGSDVAVESQQEEGDSKPSGPSHVTNIRMGDRYIVAGRGRTPRQPLSAPNRTQSAPAREGSREEKEEGNNDEDVASQKDQAVETDFAETVYDDELERLRRERQRILYMLEKDVVPSKLQVELAEAQLNYIIGQTDTLLQALEEPWDSESLMAYTAHDEQLQNISRDYLSKYRTTLEQSRVDIEQRIVELEQNAATKPEQSRVNQRILLEKERRKAVESFKRERQLEQVNFELMRETLRSRSLSPTDGSVHSDRRVHTMGAGRGRARNTQSSAMTPKQRREYLVGLRKGIVKTMKDTSSPAVSVSSGSPQITPRAISVLSPPFRSHSAGRAASHTSEVSHPPGFTMHHGNRMRSYSPAPGRRMNIPYASQSHRSSNIPSSYEAMDASSITSSIDEDSMRLLDDYQATRGRTHIEIERAREILQSGAGLHASRPSAVRTSTM